MAANNHSILICDKDELNRKKLSEILIKEGYKIELISELETHFKEIQAKEFHVLILNLNSTPTKDTSFKKMLHELTQYLPVIVVAKDGDLEVEREIRAEGVFYYIVKPVDEEEFKIVVKEAIGWYYKNFA